MNGDFCRHVLHIDAAGAITNVDTALHIGDEQGSGPVLDFDIAVDLADAQIARAIPHHHAAFHTVDAGAAGTVLQPEVTGAADLHVAAAVVDAHGQTGGQRHRQVKAQVIARPEGGIGVRDDSLDELGAIAQGMTQRDAFEQALAAGADTTMQMDLPIGAVAKHLQTAGTRLDVQAFHGAGRQIDVEDFLLASRVETALAQEGHIVSVESADGAVTLTINKKVLMLKRLEQELQSIALKVPGVKSVETKVGKDFYQADVYRKYDLEMPSKLLLVDDERTFAQTLSERLRLRDIGSLVAYDGESALNLIREEEPDVMILDLKMPGIDGIEVLKRVKETSPHIEVIILTGQGTEADRQKCMKLGAFAYLEKPVDVNILSDTIKRANEKIKKAKGDL